MIDWEQQAQGKTCMRCGKKGLTWDKDFHKQSGKWKLENHKRDDGKWCNKPPEVLRIRSKEEMILCPYCESSSFGLFKKEEEFKLQAHIKSYHPNGEILTDLDYKMMVGFPVGLLRYWTSDASFYKYQHLLK